MKTKGNCSTSKETFKGTSGRENSGSLETQAMHVCPCAGDSPLSELCATTTCYMTYLRRNSSSNPCTQRATSAPPITIFRITGFRLSVLQTGQLFSGIWAIIRHRKPVSELSQAITWLKFLTQTVDQDQEATSWFQILWKNKCFVWLYFKTNKGLTITPLLSWQIQFSV